MQITKMLRWGDLRQLDMAMEAIIRVDNRRHGRICTNSVLAIYSRSSIGSMRHAWHSPPWSVSVSCDIIAEPSCFDALKSKVLCSR